MFTASPAAVHQDTPPRLQTRTLSLGAGVTLFAAV